MYRYLLSRVSEDYGVTVSHAPKLFTLFDDKVYAELLKIRVPDLVGEVSEVSVSGGELLVGGVFPHVGLIEEYDVVSLSEGIMVVSDGLEVNLRVFGGSHVARRTIKVPHG